MPIFLKSGSLNLLEPSGRVQAYNEIALTFCTYRVIKKSLCTWRLYCNHQVHRDFLITLYIPLTKRLYPGLAHLIVEVSRLHSDYHNRWNLSGRGIGSTQRPLTKKQHSKQKDHPCSRRDTNPQSQRASGRRNTREKARQPGSPEYLYTVGVCYNERMLRRKVFVNKMRMLQRTRRNTIGRRSTRVRMTCSIIIFTKERLFMLFKFPFTVYKS